MLLSDTSGLVYDFVSPELQRYLKFQGEEPGFFDSQKARPLLFHPGKGWAYAHSLDWVGIMVRPALKLMNIADTKISGSTFEWRRITRRVLAGAHLDTAGHDFVDT